MEVYQMVLAFCNEIAITWRKTQRTNLALAVYAMLRRKSLTLSHLAQQLPVPEQTRVVDPKHSLWHRLKRLRRFLGNTRTDHAEVMRRCTHLGLVVSDEPGLRLSLLIDLTYFNPYAFLVISVPKLGRAVPIAWHAFRRDLTGESFLSQNHLIDALLARLLVWIPDTVQAVIVGDREFARASLFRTLNAWQCDFVIRVDQETWLFHSDYTGPLGQMRLRRNGRQRWFPHAVYSKGEREPVNLLAVWHPGYREPWFLATTLTDPEQVFAIYRQRMKIEHGFRDWKTHLRLKGTLRAENVAYIKGLMTVLAVLYWFISICGLHWSEPRFWSRVACWGQPSFFKVALDLLSTDDRTIIPTWPTILNWLREKLWFLRPRPPRYLLRYRRHRSWLH